MPKSWFVWMVFALALIGVGVALGEPGQMLMNATNVCLACMGVG